MSQSGSCFYHRDFNRRVTGEMQHYASGKATDLHFIIHCLINIKMLNAKHIMHCITLEAVTIFHNSVSGIHFMPVSIATHRFYRWSGNCAFQFSVLRSSVLRFNRIVALQLHLQYHQIRNSIRKYRQPNDEIWWVLHHRHILIGKIPSSLLLVCNMPIVTNHTMQY